ncbi:hypothetical protein QUF80_06150 [Desulfococcaceae bacterium HSG8]|nr:hypothetical protein [Desulfococcaceae bacterium HSG8]
MQLDQFFHIARASCAVADVEYVVVFGSNAILPWLNDLGIRDMRQFITPEDVSRELDLCVGDGRDDRLNTLVDGTIGELSQFDETFGIYAHPNPVEGLFHAPSSWQKRICSFRRNLKDYATCIFTVKDNQDLQNVIL